MTYFFKALPILGTKYKNIRHVDTYKYFQVYISKYRILFLQWYDKTITYI